MLAVSSMQAEERAFRAEAIVALKGEYAQVLLALVKAFEMVPYDWLVRQARKYGFSLRLLRLSIAAYKLSCAVGTCGSFSGLVRALRGVTAGSGFAQTELRVLLLEVVDGRGWWPRPISLPPMIISLQRSCMRPTKEWTGASGRWMAKCAIIAKAIPELQGAEMPSKERMLSFGPQCYSSASSEEVKKCLRR